MEDTKKSNTKVVFFISVAVFILFLFFLILIKANIESFTLLRFFIFLGLGIFLIVGINLLFWFFSKQIPAEEKENKLLPNLINKEQCERRVKTIMESPDYANYLLTPKISSIVTVGKGIKSNIFLYVAEGRFLIKGQRDTYAIFINMHEPDKESVLLNPNQFTVNRELNRMASYPEDSPDVEETTTENALTGTRITQKKTKYNKKPEQQKEKEDLVENE